MAREDSPPPKPPSRPPNNDELRFETITSPCEWIENYRPGSYHPVHLGDLFNDGQCKVIRKLGEGAYSTVWLARDLKQGIYVALKIQISMEGAQHVTRLLDEFKHFGLNGVHTCLVFEPMGPSVNSMVEELPQFNPCKWGMKVRYPPRMAKSILKESLQAIAFLHKLNIAHGDFQPGNMLFALDDIDSKPEDVLRQEENEQTGLISLPVKRLDGKKDLWAPRYLCIAQPLTPFTPYTEGFKIKLSDMGGACFLTDPPKKPLTPRGLRAPEMVLMGTVNESLDIWSFGCLVFELITGQPLFCVPADELEDDDHLLSLSERLGPLPDELYKQWKNSPWYYTPDRKLYNNRLGGVVEGGEPYMPDAAPISMEEAFDNTSPEIDEEEAGKVKALIRWILQYDPAKRPSAAEILRDPWFSEEHSSL